MRNEEEEEEGGKIFFQQVKRGRIARCKMIERTSLKLEWMDRLVRIGLNVKQLGASCSAENAKPLPDRMLVGGGA